MQDLLKRISRLGFRSISFWSGLIMILLMLAGSWLILFTDAFEERLHGTRRTFFVVLLLSYAVYRFFRLRQMLRETDA